MRYLKVKSFVSVFLILSLFFVWTSSIAEYDFIKDADAIERSADSVFMLEVYASDNQKIGVGSGFIAFNPSLLVTNYHVIDGGAYILAISDDKEQYFVTKLCIADKNADIAILRFDQAPGMPALELDGITKLKRSESVVAIGSPAGLMNTISIGNISAFYQRDGRDWIQFTAPISSGSSGGALFNDQGKIIGITTATYASAQNVNMAVKAKAVIDLYKSWDGKTISEINRTTGVPAPVSVIPASAATVDPSKVYVTRTGHKYHNTPTCSGMKSPIEMDLLDAIGKGYEPCDKCYK